MYSLSVQIKLLVTISGHDERIIITIVVKALMIMVCYKYVQRVFKKMERISLSVL